MNNEHRSSTPIFLMGLALGSIAALALASSRGQQARGVVKRRLGQLKDNVQQVAGDAEDSAENLLEGAEHFAARTKDKLRDHGKALPSTREV